jgi:hypothetical protein
MRLQQILISKARTRVHTDTAAEDGRRGSNVYEVNTWLWQFGRGKPRLGGLTIEETSDRQDSARKASDKRRKETSDCRKGDGA